MSENLGYTTAQPVYGDPWNVNLYKYLNDTEGEEAKNYSIDLLKIFNIIQAPASPEQLDFFDMEGVEGKYIIAYVKSKSNLLDDIFATLGVSNPCNASYSLAMIMLLFVTKNKEAVKSFKEQTLDSLIANFPSVLEGLSLNTPSAKLFFKIFTDVTHLPEISKITNNMIEAFYSSSFTETMYIELHGEQQTKKLEDLTANDVWTYTNELLKIIAAAPAKNISFNQIKLYDDMQVKVLQDENFDFSVIPTISPSLVTLEGTAEQQVVYELGLIVLFMAIKGNFDKLKYYLNMSEKHLFALFMDSDDSSSIEQLFELNDKSKENIKKRYGLICFIEGCLASPNQRFTIEELKHHLYILKKKVPKTVIMRLFAKNEKYQSIKDCYEFYFSGGGLGNIYFKTKPIEFRHKLWVPYYLFKKPNEQGLKYKVYIENEIEVNKLIENTSLDVPQLAHSFTTDLDKITFNIEFKNGITLNQYIKSYQLLEDSEAKQIFTDAAIGLNEFHNLHIKDGHTEKGIMVHRDFKHDNLIVFKSGNKFSSSIIDYGIAKKVSTKVTQTILGTGKFKAPEIATKVYNHAVDVWAFGMTVVYSFMKQLPAEETFLISKLKYVSIEAASFIEKCLQIDIKQRFDTAAEMLNHSYLKSKEPCNIYIPKEFCLSKKEIKLEKYMKYLAINRKMK